LLRDLPRKAADRAAFAAFLRTPLEKLPTFDTLMRQIAAETAFAYLCVLLGLPQKLKGRTHMDALQRVKAWIGSLTEIGLMLLALAIVAALLVGANLPFFGSVTNNIMALVKSLGDAGLVGLITLGIIVWLFSGRKIA
jgi:hypothetical protein